VIAPRSRIWAAMLVVYLVWGSTYLAIAVVVETLPALLSASVRFATAGLLMLGFLLVRSGPSAIRVTRQQLGASAVVGALLLVGGNGLVSTAERSVPSALAALVIASVPLWVVVLRVIARERVANGVLVGVAVGFAGVAALVLSNGLDGNVIVLGMLLLVAASASWATGSFLSRRLPLPPNPLVSTAVQMVCGGLLLAVVGVVTGELASADPSRFTFDSILALGYLVVFGSIVAYTAYTWLLQHAPLSTVATYAYVNPIVAVFLGWAFHNEPITVSILVGASIVLLAVAFIVRADSPAVPRLAAEGAWAPIEPSPAPEPAPVPAPRPATAPTLAETRGISDR